jgi:putative transposase
VSTWSGWVYVAFVIDAYSRRIVGWRTAASMNTALVLDAIDHAIWTRAREGVTDLTELIHHNDYAEVLVKPRDRGFACVGRDS